MLKKVLAILLSVLVVMMAVPFTVSAEGEAVATLHANGELVGEYATLQEAFTATSGYVLADNAVVTLLRDMDLQGTVLTISKGEFSLNLNGKTVYGKTANGTLLLTNSVKLTIIGSGTLQVTGTAIRMLKNASLTIESGNIVGSGAVGYAVSCDSRTNVVTVNGGSLYGEYRGITGAATVTVNGGSVSGEYGIVSWNGKGQFTVNGGSVSGTHSAFNNSIGGSHTLLITGGEITGYIAATTLTITGGTFVGGISCNKTLNSVLGEDKAYWQGDTMLQVADDATQITGGDVTVKDACHHEKGTPAYVDNGDDHTVTYSCCNWTTVEAHVFDHEFDSQCPCGSTHEVDFHLNFVGNSISEEKNGLAFRFDVNVADMGIQPGSTNRADYTNANVGGYKVLAMGFIAFNGAETQDVPMVYLYDLAPDSVDFAVRIINIPKDMRKVDITVTAYVVLEMDGEAVTIYSDAQTTNYADVAA